MPAFIDIFSDFVDAPSDCTDRYCRNKIVPQTKRFLMVACLTVSQEAADSRTRPKGVAPHPTDCSLDSIRWRLLNRSGLYSFVASGAVSIPPDTSRSLVTHFAPILSRVFISNDRRISCAWHSYSSLSCCQRTVLWIRMLLIQQNTAGAVLTWLLDCVFSLAHANFLSITKITETK